jgi:hypothetical protein
LIGRLLCLLGFHRGQSYPKRIGDQVRVWTFCKRPGCRRISIRKGNA